MRERESELMREQRTRGEEISVHSELGLLLVESEGRVPDDERVRVVEGTRTSDINKGIVINASGVSPILYNTRNTGPVVLHV
jgi:hypothetical protein